jgi:hypothetical protein
MSEGVRRPTVEVPDQAWNDVTSRTMAIRELREATEKLHAKQEQQDKRGLVQTVLMVCGAVAAIGAAIAAFSQIGLFSMKSGWLFEDKETAKTEHRRLDERIDRLGDKIDDLPKRLADELTKRPRR